MNWLSTRVLPHLKLHGTRTAKCRFLVTSWYPSGIAPLSSSMHWKWCQINFCTITSNTKIFASQPPVLDILSNDVFLPELEHSRRLTHSLLWHGLNENDTWALTHWGRDKMAAVSQATFSNAFSWMQMCEFRLRFHWNLLLRFELKISQHWFR